MPFHIWEACGVGKSQIVAQVAADLGYDFLDIHAVQLDPVDLRGFPLLLDAGLKLPEGVLVDDRYRGLSAEEIYNRRA